VGYEIGFQEGSGVKLSEVVNSDTFKFIEREIETTSKGDKRTHGQEGSNEPVHSLY
jgi:hypothetical protein